MDNSDSAGERSTDWNGTALELRGELDPYAIKEVVFEFEGGDTDTFTSRMNDDFRSYELYQMGGYIDAVIGTIRKGQRS